MDALHPWLDNYPDGVDWHAPIPTAPLHTLMHEAATRFGPRPAFDFLGRRTTWAEAASMAARVAAGLQRLGYAKGDHIGLLLPNCPAYPVMFFGALQAGLTVVNFNPLYTVRELEAQARDAGIRAIATLDLAATYPKAAALLAGGSVGQIIVCPFADMLPASKRALFRVLKRGDRAAPPRDAAHIWFADLAAPGLPPHHVEIDPYAGHAGQSADCCRHVLGDGVLQRAARDGQEDGHDHETVRSHLDGLDHAQLGDRPVDLRVGHGGQRGGNGVDGGWGRGHARPRLRVPTGVAGWPMLRGALARTAALPGKTPRLPAVECRYDDRRADDPAQCR